MAEENYTFVAERKPAVRGAVVVVGEMCFYYLVHCTRHAMSITHDEARIAHTRHNNEFAPGARRMQETIKTCSFETGCEVCKGQKVIRSMC